MSSVLSITLTGLLVVFSVLGILYIVFSLFGVTLSSEKRKKPAKDFAKVVIKEGKKQEQNIEIEESETVAVISAVLYEMIGNRSFRIRKISPVIGRKSGWKARIPQVYWKPRRNKAC